MEVIGFGIVWVPVVSWSGYWRRLAAHQIDQYVQPLLKLVASCCVAEPEVCVAV